MIECIFTLDYEIYGNGQGSLRDLVLDPTDRLADLFHEFDAPFVVFAEAVEFAKIEEAQSDPDSGAVRAQLRQLRAAGHEIALHLHPWWSNARHEGGQWQFDWSERKLGTLRPDRAEAIISGAIGYLRQALEDASFRPLAFRAGQWAIQPTQGIASLLAQHGVRVDSSVFKGGVIHDLQLDYRPAIANGAFWRFGNDVNVPDPNGELWEIPIHTELVPVWRMLQRKRLKLQRNTSKASQGSPLSHDWRDFLRFRYPRKFDFCRMNFEEMREVVHLVFEQDQVGREKHEILVAIGHSKDFVDPQAVRDLLAFLRERNISVTTFSRLLHQQPRRFS
jgi:peptidoglycan/xylan/chitin deacetylase (PgdA/CDA1 family)